MCGKTVPKCVPSGGSTIAQVIGVSPGLPAPLDRIGVTTRISSFIMAGVHWPLCERGVNRNPIEIDGRYHSGVLTDGIVVMVESFHGLLTC